MKVWVELVLSIFLALSVSSFCPADGPKIKFEKLSHDYGKVLSGQTVSAEFEFQKRRRHYSQDREFDG